MIDPITRKLMQNDTRTSPLVLVYHSITPGTGTSSWKWSVPLVNFVQQIELIHQLGYTTTCIRNLQDHDELPARTIVITFDDGYADNYSAFEALKDRGMYATWFITTNFIGQTSCWEKSDISHKHMLSDAQLKAISQYGMEIGSHSLSHARLTTLDDTTLFTELSESKLTLERVINAEVRSLAYPYGSCSDRVVAFAREVGYTTACGTASGTALVDNDPFRIRRISVFSDDNLAMFARKIAFASNNGDWMQTARYLTRRLVARILS